MKLAHLLFIATHVAFAAPAFADDWDITVDNKNNTCSIAYGNDFRNVFDNVNHVKKTCPKGTVILFDGAMAHQFSQWFAHKVCDYDKTIVITPTRVHNAVTGPSSDRSEYNSVSCVVR